MAKKKQIKVKKSRALVFMALGVAVAAVLVLGWMLAKEVYLADMKDVRESKESIVVNTVGAPADLVNVLLAEKAGCVDMYKDAQRKNVDYIVRESNDIALVHYGCALDAFMFYKKENGSWKNISPTNQFVNGVPLCSHLKDNKIPASFQAYCYDSASAADGKQPSLVANPVG